jgi:FkbM family methyltransferase
MYSQNDEEIHIITHLQTSPGRFLDVGAYDGKTFSNTRALAERGWGGILVDPAPIVFPALFNLYKERSDIKCVQVAVTPDEPSRLVPFYDSNGDGVSTLSPDHVAKWSPCAKFSPMWVQTMGLKALCTQLKEMGEDGWEFVNLDVEGLTTELFEAYANTVYNPKLQCICVEHDGNIARCNMIAQGLGLVLVHQTGENVIYAKKSGG